MEWLDDDVTYGVACALLLMLLVREVLATVAQYCVPLSRTLSWLLPTPLLHIIATCLEPIYEHLTGELTRVHSNKNELTWTQVNTLCRFCV